MHNSILREIVNEYKGITLISLIITIIILIILAGVAIDLSLGENGIFNKAKDAKEKYTVETIREKVEIGITNLEIDEVALGNEVTIELVLQELLEDETFETIDKESQIGNIGEYEVKLKYNEEGKVIIEYIQKATGVRVTYALEPVGYTNEEKVNILLKVQGKVKEVTKPDGLKIYPQNEVLGIDYEVTVNGAYKFVIEDEQGNKQEKNVIVDTIDRLAPNNFEIEAENTETGLVITANAEDAESDGVSVKSGIEKYEYFVKRENEEEYTKYEENIIEGLEVGNYEIYVIAYDKAGNKKQSDTIAVEVKLIVKFSKISAGSGHSLGIDVDGNLWAWGDGRFGELGNGGSSSYIPIQIKIGTKFKEISGGRYYSLAIDEEGNLWAWGRNTSCQLGDGTTTSKTSPVRIKTGTKFKKISAGEDFSLAIDEEGNLWTWGDNLSGKLGDGTTTDRNKPVKVMEGIMEISAGENHSLAIDKKGNLWAWGRNTYGGLGDGTTTTSKVPIQIKEGTKFKEISAGSDYSLAIDEEENLWAWGWNVSGELGDGTTTQSNIPIKIMEGIEEISAGRGFYSLAIDKEGCLWAWGRNTYGGLGDGTTTDKINPIKIKESISEISNCNHSLAIDEKGNLWAWGSGSSGKLGNGKTSNSLIPIRVFE